jgi:hypothetical protein
MKINNLLISVLLAAVLLGCGGNSQSLDASIAPPTAQRMLAGGTSHAVQADAQPTATVSIAGYRSNFKVTKDQATSVVTVTSKIDNSVTTYQNPSLIKFVDKWTSFDIDGAAGQVYRLYQAAFNRTPDLSGLGFWIAANQNGRDVLGIASDFMVSAEFKTLYGDSPANLKLINAFYNNVLHRDGEKAGVDWWIAQMSNGAPANGVLFGFSDSAENKNTLQAAMRNGFDFVPYQPGGAILVKASSYENKAAAMAAIGPTAMPTLDNGEIIGGVVAFADFLQDGSYTMVAASANFSREYTDEHGTPNRPSKVHFFQMVNGMWSDISARLLSDQTGCISARKAIVADFNGDGKPDVFLACHGYDAEPFPGEFQRMLLSTSTGYQNIEIAVNCYCHGAAAADFAGNGYADILLADQMVAKTPYFLINNRDGSFHADKTRFGPELMLKQIWTAELIDTTGTGRFDAFLAGADPIGDGYQIAPTIFRNDGKNSFHTALSSIQMAPSANDKFGHGVTLDAIFDRDNVYLLRTFNYAAMSFQKTNVTTGVSSEIYAHSGSYHPTQNTQNWYWFPWIGFANNQVVATDAFYDAKGNK